MRDFFYKISGVNLHLVCLPLIFVVSLKIKTMEKVNPKLGVPSMSKAVVAWLRAMGSIESVMAHYSYGGWVKEHDVWKAWQYAFDQREYNKQCNAARFDTLFKEYDRRRAGSEKEFCQEQSAIDFLKENFHLVDGKYFVYVCVAKTDAWDDSFISEMYDDGPQNPWSRKFYISKTSNEEKKLPKFENTNEVGEYFVRVADFHELVGRAAPILSGNGIDYPVYEDMDSLCANLAYPFQWEKDHEPFDFERFSYQYAYTINRSRLIPDEVYECYLNFVNGGAALFS